MDIQKKPTHVAFPIELASQLFSFLNELPHKTVCKLYHKLEAEGVSVSIDKVSEPPAPTPNNVETSK